MDILRSTNNLNLTGDNIINELDIDIHINSQKRYCKILYLAMQLARIGSLSTEETYDNIINNLIGLIFINSVPINSVNEPVMALPRKK